jgi:hypothetical protein
MLSSQHTQFEDFTIKGKWWTPGHEAQSVDGELKVTGGKRIELELYGDFPGSGGSWRDNDTEPETIFGRFDGGEQVTLLYNLRVNRNFGGAGHTRSAYVASLFITGAWFDSPEDVKFDSISFRLTDLLYWRGVEPFGGQTVRDGDQNVGIDATFRYPETLTVDLPSAHARVSVESEVASDSRRYRSVTLTHDVKLDVDSESPLSLDDAFQWMADLRNFFVLMIGSNVSVMTFEGEATVDALDARTKSAAGKIVVRTAVFFRDVHQQAGRADECRMPFSYRRLGGRFPDVLRAWFSSTKALRPVYEVFFSTTRNSRLYLQSQFLHLSQAVESLHRRLHPEPYVDAAEYEKLVEQIIAAIPATACSPLKEKLSGVLRFANEPSLFKRLRMITKALSDPERKAIADDIKVFMKAVKSTRNQLTHLGEPDDDEIILSGEELYRATQKLELLMTILLLKHLGIPDTEVLERITACEQFDTRPFQISIPAPTS